MMTSLAQSYSPHPGGMQPHPGMAQGHPGMAVPHNPGQPGQPGPGMPQQLHMGVSGPGPQVSQAGVMMGGMPPGAGGPSQHALQHLNPNQAAQQQQLFQQQQIAFANANPSMQQIQQQQMIQHQRQQQAARQAMLAQQYSGMPMQMANGMNQMTQAQFQAMRGGPVARPVNLPQHLQQQQQQVAEHNLQQQQQAQAQAQAQHQVWFSESRIFSRHQQQLIMAQQLAMQQQASQQAQAGNNPQGQGNQMNPQQPQNMQAQTAMMQQAHQQQQQAAHAAAASQQSQGQPQPQPQSQQAQPNAQAQAQQPQPAQQQQQGIQQQQAVAAAMLQQQQRQGEKFKGQCLMKLMQFGDHLSNFGATSKSLASYTATGAQRLAAQSSKQRDDLNYWLTFVDRFFSPKGVFRHSLWILDETSNKQYEITYPALPRYFYTHFESGVKNMQMIMEKGTEKELPNNGHYIESQKSSFVYWFDNGSQLVASGTLKAHFDADQKIELLEFVTSSHEEYIPRAQVLDAARPLHEWSKEWRKVNAPPDGKQSPEINKKKAKPMKSPPQPPPEIDLPESLVSKMGITPLVFRFLEIAEVMGQMNPLFGYSHQNSSLDPYAALNQYVATVAVNGADNSGGQQPNPTGPRTPGMGNFGMGVSPAQAHLQLPDGSPHVSGSPAPGMAPQHSQHGTSSSGPSANTSPNTTNKRRRPSVKDESEVQVNGNPSKTAVKPSPRIGGKRQKGNPA
ncbi:uncharacterized protein LY89DRAFT_699108 [Mollisia scopiformis]|uniref:Uncharacterized protein n=1 Tax=Mollisia scopiformis TaxID=149040 RepID=A0A194WZV9_MOLSC|nr:uncharacterized protein LY89DRAFT_699108 [Mollisia scopiformis]KUJ13152.1 hypothetical protein LY89DRAFT_699108 [Mollisia scopiformis]